MNLRQVTAQSTEAQQLQSLVFRWKISLLDPGLDLDHLTAAADWLQPLHVDEVCAERATARLCGFPMCEAALPRRNGLRKPPATPGVSGDGPLTAPSSCFCRPACHRAAALYAASSAHLKIKS